jgi:hypothetical protein
MKYRLALVLGLSMVSLSSCLEANSVFIYKDDKVSIPSQPLCISPFGYLNLKIGENNPRDLRFRLFSKNKNQYVPSWSNVQLMEKIPVFMAFLYLL